MTAGPVLKDKRECPCGCGAFGMLDPGTGHAKDCAESCSHCARGRRPSSRSKQIPKTVRRRVAARSTGVCEAVDRTPEGVCTGTAEHMHHRRRRSQGGLDTPSNLLHLCHGCHGWVHDHPEAAVEADLLERAGAK